MNHSRYNVQLLDDLSKEFLNNLRHDIRTPMSGIVGLAEIIKNTVDHPEMKDYADSLCLSAHTLLNFLNNVLEVIYLKMNKQPLKHIHFNLIEQISNVLLLHDAIAKRKKISLTLHVDEALPRYFVGDPNRIHRVFLELVANALKFTHQGEVKVILEIIRRKRQTVFLRVTVKDTGIGMSPEDQENIFVPFKRSTPAYRGVYDGFGLGLSIVKQLMKELHGEMIIKSQKNMGTTFIACIPLKESLLQEEHHHTLIDENELNNQQSSIQYQESQWANKGKNNYFSENKKIIKSHILLVEDHPIAAKVVKGMLENLDCIVDVATNGHDAIEWVNHDHDCDLILMDIGLPDLMGYAVAAHLRHHCNHFMIPIIGLTAHIDDVNHKVCIDAGMRLVLTKPLMHEQAMHVLNMFIPSRAFNGTLCVNDGKSRIWMSHYDISYQCDDLLLGAVNFSTLLGGATC